MNPISLLNGIKIAKVPSTYKLSSQDVSLPGAGRTMDAKMHKKRVSKKIKIELEWKVLSYDEAKSILNATSPEYFNATVLDFSGSFVTKEFYRGDINGQFYGEPVNQWVPLSFSLIER